MKVRFEWSKRLISQTGLMCFLFCLPECIINGITNSLLHYTRTLTTHLQTHHGNGCLMCGSWCFLTDYSSKQRLSNCVTSSNWADIILITSPSSWREMPQTLSINLSERHILCRITQTWRAWELLLVKGKKVVCVCLFLFSVLIIKKKETYFLN